MSETSSKSAARPLSPHLQVYKLPFNAKMSITGRGVGIGLAGAVSVILMCFIASVWNPAFYDATIAFLDNPFTPYVALLGAFVTFFYIGNGIRHVIWDLSVGVSVKWGVKSGYVALILAALLTILLWIISCCPEV